MGAEFGVQPEILAAVSSVYFTCFFLVSLVAGYLSDRFGARPVLLAGCTVTAIGGVILTRAGGPMSVVAGCVALGMGGGVIEGMCSALLTRLYPGHERFALNLSQAGYCFGAVAGPFLLAWLVPLGVNWRTCFLLVVLGALANFILFWTSTFPPVPHSGAASALVGRRNLANLRRWPAVQLYIAIFLYVFAESGLSGFLTIYLYEYRAAPEAGAIGALAFFWGVMLVGRLVAGSLPPWLPNQVAICVMMVLGGAAVTLSAGMATWVAVLAAFLVASFFMAGAWPTIVALAATRHPTNASTVVGVTVAAGALGCIFSPLLMGRLYGVIGPASAMAWLGLPLIAGGLLVIARRPRTDYS